MNLARSNVVLLYRDGVSQSEIARQAGVSKQRINQILSSFRDERTRQLSVEALKAVRVARGNHDTFLTSLRKWGDNFEAYAGNLRAFEANHQAFLEAKRRDREIRTKYLQAHPRARQRAAGRTGHPEESGGDSKGKGRPLLRLVRSRPEKRSSGWVLARPGQSPP